MSILLLRPFSVCLLLVLPAVWGCAGRDKDICEKRFYRDQDGDGFGDPEETQISCERPSGHVAKGTDCDDSDPAIHPGAEEVCDGKDNDCDAATFAPSGTVAASNGVTVEDVTADFADAAAGVWQDVVVLNNVQALYFCGGTWDVGLTASVDLAIIGDGPDRVTLSGGGGHGPVIRSADDDRYLLRVEGLTIADGFAEDGGGLYCSGGDMTLSQVVVRDSVARSSGGGLWTSSDCALITEDVVLEGNLAQTHGGGAALEGEASLSRTAFVDNTVLSGFGGGLFAEYDHPLTGEEVHFEANIAEYGGGLTLERGATLRGVTFLDNAALTYGGAMLHEEGSSVLEDVVASGNHAPDYGGFLMLKDSTLELVNASIEGNYAYFGGAIYAQEAIFRLRDSEVRGSIAEEGGAFVLDDSNLYLYDTVVADNTANIGRGGAFFLEDESGLVMKGGAITGNQAAEGAGIYIGRESVAYGEGVGFADNQYNEDIHRRGQSTTTTYDFEGQTVDFSCPIDRASCSWDEVSTLSAQ